MNFWNKEKVRGARLQKIGIVSIVFFTFVIPMFGQQSLQQSSPVTIYGRVLESEGGPLPGVSVLVVGAFKGVSTNSDGYYSITMPKDMKSGKIQFSFIGMESQTVEIDSSMELNITLETKRNDVEEVVVTGYQNVAARDVAGAITTLKAKDIENPAYTTVDKMLQGQVAGMVVVNPSSRVTKESNILIRGTSTILGTTSPLWVVDGIIQPDPLKIDASADLTRDLNNIVGSQISWLNPSDINTITILKDASATAVYGSKASNGVIVITTKKGERGKPKVTYGLTMSMRNAPNYGQYNLMNSQERIDFSQEAYNQGMVYNKLPKAQMYTYEGLTRLYTDRLITREEFEKQLSYLETVNTDWFGELTQASLSQTHNLSVSGGSDKISYLSSFSYTDNKGIEVGDEMQRITGRLRINVEMTKKLNLDLNIAVSQNNNSGFGSGVSPIDYATTTSRAIPAYNQDGSPTYYMLRSNYRFNNLVSNDGTGLGYNVLNERNNSSSKIGNTAINSSLNLKWQFLPKLRYELVVGLNQSFVDGESYLGESTFAVADFGRGYLAGAYLPGSPEYAAAILPYGGKMSTSYSSQVTYNIQNKLIFDHVINKVHRINALILSETRSNSASKESHTIWGYAPDRGQKVYEPTKPADLVPIGQVGSDYDIYEDLYKNKWYRYDQTNHFLSLLATLVYSYKDRYVLNGSVRTEDSNRFNQDVSRRFEPIWSLGGAWNFTDEPFLKSQSSWLNQGKFRASYGIQGNTLTNVSPNLIIYQGVVDPVYGQSQSSISQLPNPYLTAEKTKNWNAGIDLRLFNFFTFVGDYYNRRSDAIVSLAVPLENGFDYSKLNGGIVINKGYEFTVTFSPIRKKDITWNISFNTGKNFNKGNFSNVIPTTLTEGYLNPSGAYVLKEGYDVSSFWSFSYKGLDPNTGRPLFNGLDIDPSKVSDPTDYMTYSGTKTPDFSGGMSTSFRYKGLTLSTHFAAVIGNSIRLYNPYSPFTNGGHMPSPTTNLDAELNDRWEKPGDELYTNIPGLPIGLDYQFTLPDGKTSPYTYDMWANSDVRVVSGSFLRCNNLSLRYNFDNKMLKKYGLSDLSLSGSVNNLFVIASKDLNGFDPEIVGSRQVAPKTVSLGLNVSF